MKKAFTIVEMMIVIGILSVLLAIILSVSKNAMETARTVKCLTNMRNLAMAAQSFGMATGAYPLAGSYEDQIGGDEGTTDTEGSDISAGDLFYVEQPGWVSWYSADKYKSSYGGTACSKSHLSDKSWYASTYCQEPDVRTYCLTNGVLWQYVSCDRNAYICPTHYNSAGMKPTWSYVMNCIFFWDKGESNPDDPDYLGIHNTGRRRGVGSRNYVYNALPRIERILMFAEMQHAEISGSNGITPEPRSASSGKLYDPVLQVKIDPDDIHAATMAYGSVEGRDMEGDECIGFNHQASNMWYAHIVFADAHTEKLRYPKKGISKEEIQKLTRWLCIGKDIAFNGRHYEEFK